MAPPRHADEALLVFLFAPLFDCEAFRHNTVFDLRACVKSSGVMAGQRAFVEGFAPRADAVLFDVGLHMLSRGGVPSCVAAVNRLYPWVEALAPRAALFSVGTSPPDDMRGPVEMGLAVGKTHHPARANNFRAAACDAYQRAYASRPGGRWTSVGPVFPMSLLAPETVTTPGHYRFSPLTLLFGRALMERYGGQ